MFKNMCMYTRHEIFTKTMKIQLAFDNCFDINVRELDVNLKKKKMIHALKFTKFFKSE